MNTERNWKAEVEAAISQFNTAMDTAQTKAFDAACIALEAYQATGRRNHLFDVYAAFSKRSWVKRPAYLMWVKKHAFCEIDHYAEDKERFVHIQGKPSHGDINLELAKADNFLTGAAYKPGKPKKKFASEDERLDAMSTDDLVNEVDSLRAKLEKVATKAKQKRILEVSEAEGVIPSDDPIVKSLGDVLSTIELFGDTKLAEQIKALLDPNTPSEDDTADESEDVDTSLLIKNGAMGGNSNATQPPA